MHIVFLRRNDRFSLGKRSFLLLVWLRENENSIPFNCSMVAGYSEFLQ
jgi:hypothetical protein